MINKRILFTLLSAVLLISGTIVAIRYAQGYRPTRQGIISGTGLLSANSFPTGASLYVEGKLISATDTTINLDPGAYEIEIRKDGHTSWKKTMQIHNELVTQTNALLYPVSPSLSPLTFTGATQIHPSPDGQKILFVTASASAARKNGIFVVELSDNPLALQRGPRQLAAQTVGWDFSKAEFLWSPASDQILVSEGGKNVILDSNRFTELADVNDVTISLRQILAGWEEELYQREREQLLRFPPEMIKIATQSATNIFISPSREKLLYTASASAIIPDQLLPAIPAASTQKQERTLEPGGIYVYDRKEDRNFRVGTDETIQQAIKVQQEATPKPQNGKTPIASPTPTFSPTVNLLSDISLPPRTLVSSPAAFFKLQVPGNMAASIFNFQRHYSPLYTNSPQWLPDSQHIISTNGSTITITDYDGTNQTQVYSGPFEGSFVYPWPNGSKLIILTNFNQSESVPVNLYALGIR